MPFNSNSGIHSENLSFMIALDLTSNYNMDLSDKVRCLLPARYEIDAQDIEYFRTFNKIRLPDSSRTPTECGWLWDGEITESYLVAIDSQIYMPGQDVVFLNIGLEENNLRFGRVAYWRGQMWSYSSIGGIGPDEHPGSNLWSWTSFQGILSSNDFKCIINLDRTCYWLQLAR